MSRRYAPDHKALVLKILAAYKGDIAATSAYTGVPERTLRDWLYQIREAEAARRAAMQKSQPSQRRPQPNQSRKW